MNWEDRFDKLLRLFVTTVDSELPGPFLKKVRIHTIWKVEPTV
ncbi:hypothetical protein ACFL2Q_15805 [Thermodesulfobacteriota bacterium]